MAELVDSTEGRGDGGERVGGERRRPELGFDGRASYRARGGKGEGGTEAGAHGGLEDVVGELGGGRTAAWRRGRSPASVVKKTTVSAMERVRRCVA